MVTKWKKLLLLKYTPAFRTARICPHSPMPSASLEKEINTLTFIGITFQLKLLAKFHLVSNLISSATVLKDSI